MVYVSMFKDVGNPQSPNLIDGRERSSVPSKGDLINVDHGEMYQVQSVTHDWIEDTVQLLVKDYDPHK